MSSSEDSRGLGRKENEMSDALLKKLTEDKRWAELGLFVRVPCEARPALVREMCGHAVRAEDEEGALRMLMLLTLAIEDVEGSKPHAAWVRASVELWRLTPSYKEVPCRYDGEYRSSSRMETVRQPTLIKYKRVLIEDVIQRWRKTDSDTEAAFLLDVIVEMIKRQDPGGAEIMAELLKQKSDREHAHRNRFLEGVLRLSAEQGYGGARDMAQALWISLARTFDRQDLAVLAGVLKWLPLSNLWGSRIDDVAPTPMLEAVARDAEAYRKLHDAMRDLRAALKLSVGQIHSFTPKYWSQPPLVELSIGASKSWSSSGEEENDFHQLAHELRDQVQAWSAARLKGPDEAAALNRPRIKLKVFRPVQHGDPKLFREFTIG